MLSDNQYNNDDHILIQLKIASNNISHKYRIYPLGFHRKDSYHNLHLYSFTVSNLLQFH